MNSNRERQKRKGEGILIDAAINAFHAPDRFVAPPLPTSLLLKFRAYKEDIRNSSVLPSSIQKEIKIRMGKNQYIGRIDQVRKIGNEFKVVDIKYSSLASKELLEFSLPALIIYAYALNVKVGGVINVKNYGTAFPVFINTEDFDVKKMMLNLNDSIVYKLYRKGVIKC